MRQLKIQQRHEKASSKKGRIRVEAILNAARDLLIEEGYASLSMRKVAARCHITVGNLSYYYASKTDLLNDLVDAVIQGYIGWWIGILNDKTLSSEQQFKALITFIIEDLETRETTAFFPELWALANHEEFANEAMDSVYDPVQQMLVTMIKRLRPTLNTHETDMLAVHMMASMEGHTVFLGYGKKWMRKSANMAQFIADSYYNLVMSYTAGTIEKSIINK
ncbi:TetR/AcrR family transcriptional regulator [Kordiimonas pumila]|uniref:TetR/AcrR family transcriptional regulator n=1 Tax=Kordiimonas pumila TaxID=2161677 RepID=A0ABV7D5U6_9PROT|nr:TetR/AcrR family transcriptional regulator [Kordiimonas pumila]